MAAVGYADAAQATRTYGGHHNGGAVPLMQLQQPRQSAPAVQVSLPPSLAIMVDQIMALEAQVKGSMEAHLTGVDEMVRQALVMAATAKANNAPSGMGLTVQSAPPQRQQPPQPQLIQCSRCLMRGDASLFSPTQLSKLGLGFRPKKRNAVSRPTAVEVCCKRCTAARQVMQREAKMQGMLTGLLGMLVPGEAGEKLLKSMEMKSPNASQSVAGRKRSRGQSTLAGGNLSNGEERPTYRLGRLAGKLQERVQDLIKFKKKHTTEAVVPETPVAATTA